MSEENKEGAKGAFIEKLLFAIFICEHFYFVNTIPENLKMSKNHFSKIVLEKHIIFILSNFKYLNLSITSNIKFSKNIY